jgi:hypothetical protein
VRTPKLKRASLASSTPSHAVSRNRWLASRSCSLCCADQLLSPVPSSAYSIRVKRGEEVSSARRCAREMQCFERIVSAGHGDIDLGDAFWPGMPRIVWMDCGSLSSSGLFQIHNPCTAAAAASTAYAQGADGGHQK